MDFSELAWDAAAIVLWLPKDEEPDPSKHFKADADLSPPAPNPEGWWSLGDALIDVTSVVRDHGKVPWIKVGDVILEPSNVTAAWGFFKVHGHGDE